MVWVVVSPFCGCLSCSDVRVKDPYDCFVLPLMSCWSSFPLPRPHHPRLVVLLLLVCVAESGIHHVDLVLDGSRQLTLSLMEGAKFADNLLVGGGSLSLEESHLVALQVHSGSNPQLVINPSHVYSGGLLLGTTAGGLSLVESSSTSNVTSLVLAPELSCHVAVGIHSAATGATHSSMVIHGSVLAAEGLPSTDWQAGHSFRNHSTTGLFLAGLSPVPVRIFQGERCFVG